MQPLETLKRQREIVRGVIAEHERLNALKQKLDDPVAFHRDLCGLDVKDTGRGTLWRTFEPESPHGIMDRFLAEPFDGKGKAVFAERATGKSYSVALPYVVKEILKDRNVTVLLGGENRLEIAKRSLWVRTRMEKLDKDYGPLVDVDRWSADQWSVIRGHGRGGQDTVTVGSPDKPGTSQHWDIGVLDDPVGEWAAKSMARMADGIRWFKELYNQAHMGTRLLVFGTPWPGLNIYNFIFHKLEGGLNYEPYGRACEIHRGKHFDILFFRARTADGKVTFAYFNEAYLDAKLDVIGPEMFQAQHDCRVLGAEDLAFHGAPWRGPEELPTVTVDNETRPAPMTVYMVTDTATSTGRTRHTSISAIFVVGKTEDDHVWMLDGRMGKLGWDNVPDVVVELEHRWHPKKIIYENTGPSVTLPKSVQETANAHKAGDGERIRRLFHSVSRTADKHFRIQAHRPHVMAGKLHFAMTFPSSLFRLDDRGDPKGTLGEQYAFYTYAADGVWDGLDAVADVWGYDGRGNKIFKPPTPKDPPKEPTGFAALKQAYAYLARKGSGAA